MVNPQKENGFVPIATEIMDALIKTKLCANGWNLLMLIIRMTYGYNKKECDISMSFISEKTGLIKANICRERKRLVDAQIITFKKDGNLGIYSFQKDYSKWKLLSKRITGKNEQMLSKRITDIIQTDNNYYPNGQSLISIDNLKTTIKTVHPSEDLVSKKRNDRASLQTNRKFVKPSVDDIQSWCETENIRIDASRFWNYYESVGWVVGRNKPMRNWKAAVRNWAGRERNESKAKEDTIRWL